MKIEDIYDFCQSVCSIIEENRSLKSENKRLRKELETIDKENQENFENSKKEYFRYPQDRFETMNEKTEQWIQEALENPCLRCPFNDCSYYGESPCATCVKPNRTKGLGLSVIQSVRQEDAQINAIGTSEENWKY